MREQTQRYLFFLIAAVAVCAVLVFVVRNNNTPTVAATGQVFAPTQAPTFSTPTPTTQLVAPTISAPQMPLSDEDLAAVTKTAVAFVDLYGTYGYNTDRAKYATALNALIVPGALGTRGVNLPSGQAYQDMVTSKQVTRSASAVARYINLSSDQVTLKVVSNTIDQSTAGTTQSTSSYTLLLTSSGHGWKVAMVQDGDDPNLGSAGGD